MTPLCVAGLLALDVVLAAAVLQWYDRRRGR